MERRRYALRDGEISALHFGRTSNPLKLVFCHANGFNAQSYRHVLEPLGVHAVALDMRGHGESRLPTPDRLPNWYIFRDDIAEFFDRYVDRPVVLAGHSFGAVSAILSLPQTGAKVTGYAGFDPVLVPWLFRKIAASEPGRRYMRLRIPIARKAGERRAVFDSVEAAFERYQGRGAFKTVPDAILRDYVEGGTTPNPDGTVRLSCDPKWEQKIFTAQAHNVFARISNLPDATRIVFAGAQGKVSTGGQRKSIAKRQPHISVEFESALSHLFPLQEPEFATDVLRSVIAKAALGAKRG